MSFVPVEREAEYLIRPLAKMKNYLGLILKLTSEKVQIFLSRKLFFLFEEDFYL